MGRRNAEHWTGDLYMRRISPYVTRVLLGTAITANGVTVLMIVTGAAAGGALLLPGLAGVVLAALLGQLQMLWDCCDGEVARWRRTFSPAGFFLDKLGHTIAEAAIPLALGVRADGGLGSLGDFGGWTCSARCWPSWCWSTSRSTTPCTWPALPATCPAAGPGR